MNAHGMRLAVIGICLSFFLAACGTVVAPETPADQPAAEASGAQGDQPAAEAAAPASGAPAAAGAADLSGDLVINTWGDVEADPNHPSYVLHTLIQQWAADHPNVNVTYQPMLGTVPDRFGYIATSLRS
jgi:ABC-type glycerol-3-phosphate transport system substrate-binding protein